MSEQLDVFLGVETKPFLEKLFVIINSEEYLTSVNLDEHNTSGTTIGTFASPSTDASENLQNTEIRECTPPLLEQKAKDNLIIKNEESTPSSVQSGGCSSIGQQPPVITTVVTPLIKNEEFEILVKDSKRRRTPLKSRSRSRSRSYDRSRRSRSRERRLNEREKPVRTFRNKSPPNRRYGGGGRQFQRVQRQRSNSGSRSRSGSLERRNKISRSISPTNDDNQLSQSSKRQRCRDFDEKGYCMRGETCPWDHGVDPVVLEDINNPALISIQGGPNNLRGQQQVHGGGGGGGEYNPDAPDLWSRGNNNNFGQRGGSHRGSYPRGPANSNFRGPPFPFPINSAATTPLQQRELIPVQTIDGSSSHGGGGLGDNSMQSKRRFEPEDTVAIADGPTKRKLPINSRLGPRINPQQNCSLELRKVPRGLNSIAHLNNHFSKFGKIINIQISYECDPEAAIITFSTHAEANVAYRSTEAVLNNRFIKVFWHTAGGISSENQIHPIIGINQAGKDDNLPNRRIYTSQHALNNIPAIPVATTTETINKITSGINSSTTTTISTSTSLVNLPVGQIGQAGQQQQTPAQIRFKHNDTIRAKNELIRKKQEEQHKNAVQLQHGLHKRKHDLLQEHLKQMRSLLERVEKVEHSDPRRSNFLTTIKGLQLSIDKLRNEIAIDQAQISARMQNPIVPVKKSKEQQQKELLDVELELITQQQEGNDTTAIQKRLSDLQRSFGGGGARGAYFPTRNVRVKPAPPGSTSVDRRPTSIQIVGFSIEESDSLLGHFKVCLDFFFCCIWFSWEIFYQISTHTPL